MNIVAAVSADDAYAANAAIANVVAATAYFAANTAAAATSAF